MTEIATMSQLVNQLSVSSNCADGVIELSERSAHLRIQR